MEHSKMRTISDGGTAVPMKNRMLICQKNPGSINQAGLRLRSD